ncbi:MAG: hypothetical protein HXY22_04470 [Alphaproteobacteria bacterium]|nr:hypothetical protein [Alphaproteobacteria bacterium]
MALTNKEASLVLGMAARGDNDHDIAAWFGVNQGRIAEVKKGDYGVSAAPAVELPPAGPPGVKGRRLKGAVDSVLKTLQEKGSEGVAESIERLSEALACYNRNEA